MGIREQVTPTPRPRSPDGLPGTSRVGRWLPLVALGGIAALVGIAYLASAGFRAGLAELIGILTRGDSADLRDYLLSFGPYAPVVSLAVMVAQALVPPIPSFLVIFANGLAFGTVWGGLLSLAGGMLAALAAFAVARLVGRAPVEALVGRAGLATADRWFARRGAWAIVLVRVIPGLPVDAISYAAGLTGMAPRRFVAATAVGMLPQTALYAYLGEHAPHYLWALCAVTVLVMGGGAGLGLLLRHRRYRRARARRSFRRNARLRVPGGTDTHTCR